MSYFCNIGRAFRQYELENNNLEPVNQVETLWDDIIIKIQHYAEDISIDLLILVD